VLRINAVELLRHPGATRRIEESLSAAEVGIDDSRVTGDIEVGLDVTSTIDGLVVHGTVSTPWHGQCRRCLIDVEGVSVSEVEELFQQHPQHDEAVEILGDQIDLTPILREYVLLDLPDAPLCREACAGICPQCGADRNVDPCDCHTGAVDPRWSVLDELELDDE
jgi:uncharacterized protein